MILGNYFSRRVLKPKVARPSPSRSLSPPPSALCITLADVSLSPDCIVYHFCQYLVSFLGRLWLNCCSSLLFQIISSPSTSQLGWIQGVIRPVPMISQAEGPISKNSSVTNGVSGYQATSGLTSLICVCESLRRWTPPLLRLLVGP